MIIAQGVIPGQYKVTLEKLQNVYIVTYGQAVRRFEGPNAYEKAAVCFKNDCAHAAECNGWIYRLE